MLSRCSTRDKPKTPVLKTQGFHNPKSNTGVLNWSQLKDSDGYRQSLNYKIAYNEVVAFCEPLSQNFKVTFKPKINESFSLYS